MTSTIDGLASPADSEKQRIPLISWRLVTALLALLAMVAILFWVPVPFVVSSPDQHSTCWAHRKVNP